MLNVKLLKQIKEHILAEPKRLYMGSWGYKSEKEAVAEGRAPACGTVGCIAGWAVLLTHPSLIGPRDKFTLQKYQKFRTAMFEAGESAPKLLGVDDFKARRLFYVENWPREFEVAYNEAASAGDREAMAQATADRIDHFIKTGE